MNWDYVERITKLIGIIVGVISVIGVWYSIRDLTQKESEKKADEWQRSVVYQLIEQNPGIIFKDLSVRYGREASKISEHIPTAYIDDDHLRLAVLNLIQGNAINVTSSDGLIVKKNIDQSEAMALNAQSMAQSMGRALDLSGVYKAKANKHILLAAKIVRENGGKLTESELRDRLYYSNGADQKFIESEFSTLLAEMLGTGRVSEDSEGRLYFGPQAH